jgi:hypothetical protein
MSEQGSHCPFLNRSDIRCSNHFSLERLDHAFRFCFDQYQKCPAYLELLVERRVRRMTGSVTTVGRSNGASPLVQIKLNGRPDNSTADGHRQQAA